MMPKQTTIYLFRMVNAMFIVFFILMIGLTIKAQPCNFPLPPSNTCANAPLLCDLDGYCSSNNGAVNSGTPNAFCGQVENNNWVSFIAGSTIFTLKVTVSNCNQGSGLQAQIFATTDCQNFTAVSGCIDPVVNTAMLTAVDLTIGETYYLMMDGKGGDVCNYVFELISGSTLSPAHADIQPAGSLCENGTLNLVATGTTINSSLGFEWTTIGGNFLTEASSSSVEIDTEGLYKVVIVDSGGCTDSSEVFIPLLPNPQIMIEEPEELDCLLNSTININASSDAPDNHFEWTGPGVVSGGMTNEVEVDAQGVYQLVVTHDITGCSSTMNVEVFTDIETPIAVVNPMEELNCLSPTLALNGAGSSVGNDFSYQWTTATGNILADENTLHPIIDQEGLYQLRVTNQSNGCVALEEVLVTLNDKEPTSASIAVFNPCYGEISGGMVIDDVVGGTPPYLYAFDSIIFQNVNSKEGLAPDSYHIIIQDATGCEWDTLILLEEQRPLIVDLGEDDKVSLGETFRLNALVNRLPAEIDTVIWTPVYDCVDCFEQTVLPLMNMVYSVQMIDHNGCTSYDLMKLLLNRKRNIFIPNVFSPNDDGFNDIFYINGGKGVAEVLDFSVFDRWGGQIAHFENFQPNDPTYGWEGDLNNKKTSGAVYVYSAKVKFIDGEIVVFTGDVTLIR